MSSGLCPICAQPFPALREGGGCESGGGGGGDAAAQAASRALAADNRLRVARLKPLERQVLVLLAKGLHDAEISQLVLRSQFSIADIRKRVYAKLDVSGACEAAVLAAKAGLV